MGGGGGGGMGGAVLADAVDAARQLPLWQYFLLLCLTHMAILSQQLTMVQVLENSNYIPASIGVSLATWGDMTGLPSYATFALASMFISGEMADSFNRPRLLGGVLVILSALTMVRDAPRDPRARHEWRPNRPPRTDSLRASLFRVAASRRVPNRGLVHADPGADIVHAAVVLPLRDGDHRFACAAGLPDEWYRFCDGRMGHL